MDDFMNILLKPLIILSLLLTFSANSFATTIKPALWKVEHQGNVSYLFGSIHIGNEAWYPIPKVVTDAYASSQSLVVELDALSHGEMFQYAMLIEQGGTLKQKLSADMYQKLDQHVAKYGLPMAAIERFKPWAAATVVALLPYMKQGLSPQHGIDSYFLKMAKSDKKTIVELETPQFQLEIISSAFGDESAMLELINLPDSEVVKLIEHWKNGDMDKLDALAQSQMSPSQIKQMLTDRNNDWVGKIKQLISNKQQQFIVVGAAHLAGKGGVPALLKQQGINVTRINY